MKHFPSTSEFPLKIVELPRSELETSYLSLRDWYKRLKISRGLHVSHSKTKSLVLQQNEAIQATKSDLEARIRAIAIKEASVSKEIYEILDLVTDAFEQFEDAGNKLVLGYEEYETGRRSFQGGRSLKSLLDSVRDFFKSWKIIKDIIKSIALKQVSVTKKLEEKNGRTR